MGLINSLISSVWFDVTMAILCIICAALAAGLTIGLVSMNQNELILLTINGTSEEKAQAKRILPLLKDYHTLIVTMFLFNAIANEALPIFISGFMHKYLAIVTATILVLVFGEILPSSVFSGPNRLKIAHFLFPVTMALLFIFYPVAKPIGLLLDWGLGNQAHERQPFNAKDLFTLLAMSDEVPGPGTGSEVGRSPSSSGSGSSDASSGNKYLLSAPLLPPGMSSTFDSHSPLPPPSQRPHGAQPATSHLNRDNEYKQDLRHLLDHDSVLIAQGAILCGRKRLLAIVQPSFVETSADAVVDLRWFEQLGRTGYSRVLVRQESKSSCCRGGDDIAEEGPLLGYIVLKELLGDLHTYLGLPMPPDPDPLSHCAESLAPSSPADIEGLDALEMEPPLARELPMHPVQYFSPSHTVLQALNVMQSGVSRVGVLTMDGTSEGSVLGFFTLEDVLEEVIQEEIEDEKDVLHLAARRREQVLHSLRREDSSGRISSSS